MWEGNIASDGTDPHVLVDIYGHIAPRALVDFDLLRKAVSTEKEMNAAGG